MVEKPGSSRKLAHLSSLGHLQLFGTDDLRGVAALRVSVAFVPSVLLGSCGGALSVDLSLVASGHDCGTLRDPDPKAA
eukprot:scaffold2722_cov233-Pinguiococcus_pyrenoidosus.AAC.2